jgi:SAM-dependent methyltransferase
MPWSKPTYQRFFPSLTYQSSPQLSSLVSSLPAQARIADLGAGGRKITPTTICVDFLPAPQVDVVADVQHLPFLDNTLDLLIATGLLEHVEDERIVLSEIARVLRPGGLAHIEMPFLQQYHEDPIDCRRMTIDGLERSLRRSGLTKVRSGFHIGPTVTLITLFTYYCALWFEGRNVVLKALSTGVFLLASILLWPFKFLDKLLLHRPSAHRLAFGIYCTARKGPA